MKSLLVSLLVSLIASSAALAAPAADDMLRLSVALGGAWERYTGENKVIADAGNAIAGRSHLDADLDLTLYFRPTSQCMLFGVSLDALTDNWWKDPSFARLSQAFLAVRAVYYFKHELALGPYVHGDVGPAAFTGDVGTTTGRTTQSTSTSSPLGIGVRVGAGYALKVSGSVSLFAEANWGYRKAGAASAMPVVLSGGILF